MLIKYRVITNVSDYIMLLVRSNSHTKIKRSPLRVREKIFYLIFVMVCVSRNEKYKKVSHINKVILRMEQSVKMCFHLN
jgi:hypothetical protein